MKIALFGGTGKSGSLLLERFLNEGYSVRALVRDRNKIGKEYENLIPVEGDVLDQTAVDDCISGCEMVYILLGVEGKARTTVLSEGTANIIRSMEKHGVRRVVCLTSAGVLGRDVDLRTRIWIFFNLRGPFRDKKRQLRFLTSTGLDWTIVRSTEFNEDRPSGPIDVNYHRVGNPSISMSSLIDFLFEEAGNREYIRKMPIIGDE